MLQKILQEYYKNVKKKNKMITNEQIESFLLTTKKLFFKINLKFKNRT